jgi:hypothetical protein
MLLTSWSSATASSRSLGLFIFKLCLVVMLVLLFLVLLALSDTPGSLLQTRGLGCMVLRVVITIPVVLAVQQTLPQKKHNGALSAFACVYITLHYITLHVAIDSVCMQVMQLFVVMHPFTVTCPLACGLPEAGDALAVTRLPKLHALPQCVASAFNSGSSSKHALRAAHCMICACQ